MIRWPWIAFGAVVLGGAGTGAYFWINRTPEEVLACRTFAQSKLRSPSTYREARVRSFDRSTTEAEIQRLYYPDTSDELSRMNMSLLRGRQLGLRSVFLEYDADNAFGTPVRGIEGCDFLLVDGNLDGAGSLDSRARSAALDADTARLAETLNNPDLRRLARRQGDGMPCCVRR